MAKHKKPCRQACRAAALLLAESPLRFVSACWPDMQLCAKQREVLLSVRDNVETFVHAANSTGKSRVAALAVLWFFTTRTPARVITSSSSETQLNAILWSEIESLIRASRYPLPFVVKNLCIKKLCRPNSTETEPSDYVLGHVANAVENFQGHHLPHDKPRVLAVFDESSGVPDEFYQAADSWAHRKLVIGNPLSTGNFFYRLCRGGDAPDPAGGAGLLRKVIHVDGRDSPNVQLGIKWKESGKPGSPPVLIPGLLSYAEFVRREQQWDEMQRTTRLYGRFYEGEGAVLFPSTWLDAAEEAWEVVSRMERGPFFMGVDVAEGGRDLTVWLVMDRLGIVEVLTRDTPDTSVIPTTTIALMRKYAMPAKRVAFDRGGGGKQHADRLKQMGHRVRAISFGGVARDRKSYVNRRAEMYGRLRMSMNPANWSKVQVAGGGGGERWERCLAYPPSEQMLREELAVLPLWYHPKDGRMEMMPKDARRTGHGGESIRALLGRSPDRADALVLANWAMVAPLRPPAPRIDHPVVYTGDDGGNGEREKRGGRTLADRIFGPARGLRIAGIDVDSLFPD